MLPHQQRVVDEKKELDDKVDKLSTFTKTKIFFDLSIDEQDRLIQQLQVMQQYSHILGQRIHNFPK